VNQINLSANLHPVRHVWKRQEQVANLLLLKEKIKAFESGFSGF
jgi:hypothetical protein